MSRVIRYSDGTTSTLYCKVCLGDAGGLCIGCWETIKACRVFANALVWFEAEAAQQYYADIALDYDEVIWSRHITLVKFLEAGKLKLVYP